MSRPARWGAHLAAEPNHARVGGIQTRSEVVAVSAEATLAATLLGARAGHDDRWCLDCVNQIAKDSPRDHDSRKIGGGRVPERNSEISCTIDAESGIED